MKPLHDMNNADKIKLITQLLPDQVVPMLDYVQSYAKEVIEDDTESGKQVVYPMDKESWCQMAKYLDSLLNDLRRRKHDPNKVAVFLADQGGFLVYLYAINLYVRSTACQDKYMRVVMNFLYPS